MIERAKLILNVDDDEAGRYAVGRQLKQAGYEIIETATGQEALELASERQPDLILLDVRLPDIDGFEVCRRLRENPQTAGMPIVQMSASYLDTSSRVRGLENGADAYLTEPTDPSILIATLKSVLRMKSAEQTVRDSAAQWQSTFDAIQEGVAVLDLSGSLLKRNKAFELLNVEASENLNAVLESGMRKIRDSASRFSTEYNEGGKSLAITLDPLLTGGELAGAVCVATDITEKKRFDEHLHQTAKLESLGVLAGGIAHDFNNLLTGIIGNASLALETLPEGDSVRSLIAEVMSAGERAALLTRQLLAYAGQGRFVVEPINLSNLTREISALIRTSVSKNVQVRLELSENLPSIEGDASQLTQLIMNLVINAAESILPPANGTVLVTTSLQNSDSDLTAARSYVTLEVLDTGCGMDESTLSRIFDPFFTTKFTGRGLGLSAAQGIVRAHSGVIDVVSIPGQGTTFRILFPAAQSVSIKKTIPTLSLESNSEIILVVDDEDVIRRTAKAMLERSGYTVLLAENGLEGVALFKVLAERVSAVLLDMTMPVMSGEETLRGLIQIKPDAKIILSSGYNEREAVNKFKGLGIAAFLQKPYSSTTLVSTMRSVLKAASRTSG